MHPKDFLENLQSKPYQTRVKILWVSILILGVILLGVFVFGVKQTVSNLSGHDLIKLNSEAANSSTADASLNFAQVERVEINSSQLKIYFNFNNPTSDILNISSLQNITLDANGQQIKPLSITDRQGNAFIVKVLSHTQVFGILNFPSTNASLATLSFDQMSLDQHSSQFFHQTLKLNLDDLNKSAKIRN